MPAPFAQALEDAWSPPVSPWGTPCATWPDREWFGSNGLLQVKALPTPHFYREGDYPVGAAPGSAWYMWSAECSESEEAKLVGAMRILQSVDSKEVLAALQSSIPGLGSAVEAAISWVIEDTSDQILIGRNPTETPQRNPFWSVAYAGESGISGLFTAGVDSPGTFTFPLVWDAAMQIPTADGGSETLSLPKLSALLQEQAVRDDTWTSSSQTLEESLQVLAAGIHSVTWDDPPDLGVLPEVLSVIGTVWDVLVIGFNPIYKIVAFDLEVSLQLGLDRFSVALVQASVDPNLASSAATVLDGFVGILDTVADTIDDKLLPLAALVHPVSSSAARTLEGIGESVRGVEEAALFGLSEELAGRLIKSLDAGGSATVPAVIHFSTSSFSWYFDDFQPGYAADGVFVGYDNTEDASKTHGQRWIAGASPSLQYAFALDLAASVLQQVLNANSVVMAVSDLVEVEGPLGSTFRSILSGLGLGCVEEMLDGHGVSWFIAQLWKQAMVDRLLYKWALENPGDLDCLYEVFCWMKEPEARARLDTMLGAVDDQGYRPYTLLAEMFAEGATKVCEYWAGLDCQTREDIQQVVADWGCLSSLFGDFEEEESWSIEHADLDLPDHYVPYAVERANLQYSDVPRYDPSGIRFEPTPLPHLKDWIPAVGRDFWGIELERDVSVVLDRAYRVPDFLRQTALRW